MRYLWILIFIAVLVWSAINPKDMFTWFLEVVPALIGVVIMAFTYKTFPLTTLLSTLILIHMIILMVGGHYTYAEVPLFDWLKDILHQDRNNYDKVGHFAQGFIPAILAREILLRKHIVQGSKAWLNYIILSIVLAFSALYELLEWWAALAFGADADAFLATQGDQWDTQWDMFLCLLGAIASLLLFSRWHDRQLGLR